MHSRIKIQNIQDIQYRYKHYSLSHFHYTERQDFTIFRRENKPQNSPHISYVISIQIDFIVIQVDRNNKEVLICVLILIV